MPTNSLSTVSTFFPSLDPIPAQIHEFIDGKEDTDLYKRDFGFRLLYNGDVYTSRIKGCPKDHDICDIDVLLDRIEPFAKRDRPDCAMSSDAVLQDQGGTAQQNQSAIPSSTGGILLLLGVVVVSALFGATIGATYTQRSRDAQVAVFTPLGTNGGQYRDNADDGLDGQEQGGYRDEPENDDLAFTIDDGEEGGGDDDDDDDHVGDGLVIGNPGDDEFYDVPPIQIA